MRLRARTSKGLINVGSSLSPESTVSDLYKDLESHLSYSNPLIKLGFPPKPLQANQGDLLSSLGLKDGDILVVDQAAKQIAESAEPFSKDSSEIRLEFGYLVPRIMKDDNSCLFRTIAYLFLKDAETHPECRKIVASRIMENPFDYNEAILGKEPSEYCKWIMKSNSWGGAIELSIFSDHFQTSIVSLDVSTGRADCFGGNKYQSFAFAIYSGIHYDALVVSPEKNSPAEWDLTVFEGLEAQQVRIAAQTLAEEWKRDHKYTDLAKFTLRCGNCQKGLIGQKEAQEHAMKTGHANFEEYK